MKKAIVLLSGGQDSTTCLYWAKQNFNEVHAIGFDYGQTHVNELFMAEKIARDAKVHFEIFTVKNLLCPSSLTKGTSHNEPNEINNALPSNFTAGRNLLFLIIASSYAAQIGANDLVTGVCQTDFNNYPDCRRNTVDAVQLAVSLGVGIGDIRIHTPLMYLTKAETWKLANELNCLNVIIEDTLTDYNGSMQKNEWGYGENNNAATALRIEGYYEAKQRGWI